MATSCLNGDKRGTKEAPPCVGPVTEDMPPELAFPGMLLAPAGTSWDFLPILYELRVGTTPKKL